MDKVTVVYVLNGTTKEEEFTGVRVAHQMGDNWTNVTVYGADGRVVEDHLFREAAWTRRQRNLP